jgi:hypothetical protein
MKAKRNPNSLFYYSFNRLNMFEFAFNLLINKKNIAKLIMFCYQKSANKNVK